MVAATSTVVTPAQPTFAERVKSALSSPAKAAAPAAPVAVTTDSAARFDGASALRNAGIGAAVGGVVGGVSLIGRVALPVLGKVSSVSGLVRAGALGAVIGVGIEAAPVLAPHVKDFIKQHPASKAALIGAGIGGAASLFVPFLPLPIGALVGAGLGLAVHALRNQPEVPAAPDGYTAYPGYVAVGKIPVGEISSTSSKEPATATLPMTSSSAEESTPANTDSKPKPAATSSAAAAQQQAQLQAQTAAQQALMEQQIIAQMAASGLPTAGLSKVVTPPGVVTASSPAVTAGTVPVLTGLNPSTSPALPARPGTT